MDMFFSVKHSSLLRQNTIYGIERFIILDTDGRTEQTARSSVSGCLFAKSPMNYFFITFITFLEIWCPQNILTCITSNQGTLKGEGGSITVPLTSCLTGLD